MDREREKLFEEFSPSNRAEWESKIARDCGGMGHDQKLIWETPENINVSPFYCAEDLKNLDHLEVSPAVFPFVRGTREEGNVWEIRQDIYIDNASAANDKALFLIDKGVDAIGFEIGNIKKPDYQDFKILIDNIDLKKISLHWTAIDNPVYLMDYFQRLFNETNTDPDMLRGSVCVDPLGNLTCTGGFMHSLEEDMKPGEQLLKIAGSAFPNLRIIAINGQYFADAGGSCIQELAFSLSTAAEYLSFYTDQGMQAEDIIPHMQLNLSTGSNYFFEIAKIRAARLLWSNLTAAYHEATAKTVPVHIQSITANWNKTVYDSRVNLLRLTTEAMAAILGGCNSLRVAPYDSCFRKPDDFSERLARNLQIILREESYFDKVADPAGGAYYIESLTDSICDNAWQIFLDTEKKGGFLKAIKNGFVQKEIRKNADQLHKRIATGRQALVGVNSYPDFRERATEIIDPDVFNKHSLVNQTIAEPIVQSRISLEFEKIRLAVENHSNNRPKVFMLTFGNQAMRLARSQFASNFFAAAGYEVINNPGFETLSESVSAALRAKADIIVACSSDEEYEGTVPEINGMIDGKAILVVAGAPACMDELKSKGINDFIYSGLNRIETMIYFHNKLGIVM